MPPVSEPSWRKPAGILGLLAWVIAYALIVSSLADRLNALPTFIKVPTYLVLGLAWVLPLKPLFLWMNTGRWQAPRQ